MAFYKGKKLTINSDCSYSGNWVKDCAKTLDSLSIPSCGHHTKKKEILFNIWSSCDVNENATALCYVNEAIEFDETNKTVVTAYHKSSLLDKLQSWVIFDKSVATKQKKRHVK